MDAITRRRGALSRIVQVVLPAFLVAGCPGREPDPPTTSAANTTETQWVVRQAAPSRVALVYVHGIFGDTIGTWTNSNGTRFFNLVDTVPGVAGQTDMLAFGFPSSMFGSGSFDIREAANRLHLRLDHHGVLTYQKIVFIAHSMGGLVVLRELLTHAEVRARVPVLVFFATPQEGSDITRIAKYVSGNPALLQMLPADANELLQTLSDEWNSIPAGQRVPVRCAYEKLDTYGVLIVPWSSATRFCEGSPPAISASHVDIVKPDRADSDAVAVAATALKQYVFNTTLEPKLETPDFTTEGDHFVISLPDAVTKQPARLVNAGGSVLRFTILGISDPSLHVWPEDTPKEIKANGIEKMSVGLGFGATLTEYRFVLRTDTTGDTPVIVRVPNLAAVRAQQATMVADASMAIGALLADPAQAATLKAAAADDQAAPDLVVRTVRDSVARAHPDLPASGSWVLAAEVLNTLNWPSLSVRALRQAEKVSPSVTTSPAVQRLAAATASASGESRIFEGTSTPILSLAEAARLNEGPAGGAAGAAALGTFGNARTIELATGLQQVPALKIYGLSLQGDAQKAAGATEAARRSFQDAVLVRPTPSVLRRMKSVEAARPDK